MLNVFNKCHALTGVTIPDSVTTIEKNMFEECLNLTYVSIGNNVTSIKVEAFQNCPKLTSFTIPNRVTSIGDRAFKGCSSLSNIYFDGTETLWGQVNKGKGWKPAAAKEHWRCTVTFDANGHGTHSPDRPLERQEQDHGACCPHSIRVCLHRVVHRGRLHHPMELRQRRGAQ